MSEPGYRLHPAMADRIARIIVWRKRHQGTGECSDYVYRHLGDEVANDGTHPHHRQIMDRVEYWRNKNVSWE